MNLNFGVDVAAGPHSTALFLIFENSPKSDIEVTPSLAFVDVPARLHYKRVQTIIPHVGGLFPLRSCGRTDVLC